MGELGLFYRLAPIVFIGGTLVPHGGQNPLEAARLGCAIIAGPHMENFATIAAEMKQHDALIRVKDVHELTAEIQHLLTDSKVQKILAENALKHVNAHKGTLASITEKLQPYLKPDKS
jgi:3-deoxy-D-manno-octulosonic-acid transferase